MRTPPICSRCSNHGIKIGLKGHKRYCKYRNCNCKKCCEWMERQRAMALQTALRCAQIQDQQRVLNYDEILPDPQRFLTGSMGLALHRRFLPAAIVHLGEAQHLAASHASVSLEPTNMLRAPSPVVVHRRAQTQDEQRDLNDDDVPPEPQGP